MKRSVNPQWNKYEASLLLEALINVKDGHCSRKEAVINISNRFRRKAILDKLPISETYRNENGIAFGSIVGIHAADVVLHIPHPDDIVRVEVDIDGIGHSAHQQVTAEQV